MNDVKINQDSDTDSEEDDWSGCPGCGKKLKNVLLHLKKSPVCSAAVSEEDYKKMVQQSKVKRKMKKRQWEIERRMKDNDKMKTEQNKRKQKSRTKAKKNNYPRQENLMNFYWKLKSKSLARQQVCEKQETRRCPVCKKKCKNVLLHVSKSLNCNELIRKEDLVKLSEESEKQKMKRQFNEWRALKKEERKKMQEDRKNQKLNHGNEKDSEDDEYEVKMKIPERCPNCNIKKKNILLHIQCTDMCYKMINKQDLQEWRKMARKKTKKKYQLKFDKGGGHNKARSIRREEEYKRKKFESTRRFQKDRVKCKKNPFHSVIRRNIDVSINRKGT